MTYYILPHHNNNILINLICDKSLNGLDIYLSYSLYNNYNNIKTQLINICIFDNDASSNTFEEIIKIINPCEYIFSKVPGYIFSVSKLSPQTNSFYDFLEIVNILNVYENYKNKEHNFLFISPNFIDIVKHLKLVREKHKNDVIVGFNETNIINSLDIDLNHKFNFIFIENANDELINIQSYVISLINNLKIILKYQNKNGITIIKINHIFYKPIVDILYILTFLYDNVSIIKPTSCNIISFEKYIICKNFLFDDKDKIIEDYYNKLTNILNYLKTNNNSNVLSLIDNEMPCYFVNKLNDVNITLGQQQLELLYQIINILKNKNKEEKIEIVKKNNIQKSIHWCEKHQIPFNKFLDKNNIFMNTIKEIN
jgi:hypothetical protein